MPSPAAIEFAHAGDEEIAHLDLAHQPQRRAVEQNDIDGYGAWAPVGQVGLHFLGAGGVDLSRGPIAVVEAPDAPFIRGHRSGKHDADAVVARRQIDLAHAVPLADFQQLAGAVDAQSLHRIAGPAAAIGLARQQPLGRQHPVAARCGDVTLEVGVAAEQAKPVLDLPLDAWRAAASQFGVGSRSAPGREHEGNEAKDTEMAHGTRQNNGAMTSTPDAAEM